MAGRAWVARQWARLVQDLDREDEAVRLMETATVLTAPSIGERTVRARDARCA